MATRVVSTKLNEEEHRRIMEICSDKGITVSKLLKKTLMERIREEKERKTSSNNFDQHSQKSINREQIYQKNYQENKQSFEKHEDRFMYY